MDISALDQVGYLFASLINQFMPIVIILAAAGMIITVVPQARRWLGWIK